MPESNVHTEEFSVNGDEILASMDGKEVVKVHNEGYPGRKAGMAYLMSSYDPNCFDNVSVTARGEANHRNAVAVTEK